MPYNRAVPGVIQGPRVKEDPRPGLTGAHRGLHRSSTRAGMR